MIQNGTSRLFVASYSATSLQFSITAFFVKGQRDVNGPEDRNTNGTPHKGTAITVLWS